MDRTLLVISASDAVRTLRSRPAGPIKDYIALAGALNADVVDRSAVAHLALARHGAQRGGYALALAWRAFQQRHAYDAIVTDGEHIGLPLALLLKASGSRVAHVSIGHRISAPKKRFLFKRLKAHSHITRLVLHASRQRQVAVKELGIPSERVALVPYQADAGFWRPQPLPEERLVSSAGRELRDFQTFFRAVDGLDAQVVVASGSPWSSRRDTTTGERPANVRVETLAYPQLRDLYARSAVVAVPVQRTDFQAGVTTILEAMAVGKPVVVTRTEGQCDVVEGALCTASGEQHEVLPAGFLRDVAAREGVALEPNGLYVPPEDPVALRRAITDLMAHPQERARLGAAARRTVESLLTVEHFARRMRGVVDAARQATATQQDANAASAPPALVATPT